MQVGRSFTEPTLLAAADSTETGGSIRPGTVLFGEYEILGELGSGGMGTVYRARHHSLRELRAIKVMRPEFTHDATGLELFLREAHALLRVQHDAVVRCHDLLSGADGRYYLVTELVEGQSLRAVLRERRLPLGEVMAMRERLLSGLVAAHTRGIVHRDISPENIILPEDRPELAKLIDFGIAKVLSAQTTTFQFKGKLAYASPEQFGLFGGCVDGRSDIYSLGLVLVEAATGMRPENVESFAAAVDAKRREVALPAGLPSALRSALKPMLMPDPAQRGAGDSLTVRRGWIAQFATGRWIHMLGLLALAAAAALWWTLPDRGPQSSMSASTVPTASEIGFEQAPVQKLPSAVPVPPELPPLVPVSPELPPAPPARPVTVARPPQPKTVPVPGLQTTAQARHGEASARPPPVEEPPKAKSAVDSYQWGRPGAGSKTGKWYEDLAQ